MLISVIPIGNSKGIRLPKTIIEQLKISDQLELKIEDQKIVLKPVFRNPRIGWPDLFKEMHKNKDDNILIKDEDETEDFEWEW